MSEEARAALCRGTLTGIDIEQVRAARERLVALQCTIPAPTPVEAPPVPMRTYLLAGLLIGAIVWLTLG